MSIVETLRSDWPRQTAGFEELGLGQVSLDGEVKGGSGEGSKICQSWTCSAFVFSLLEGGWQTLKKKKNFLFYIGM